MRTNKGMKQQITKFGLILMMGVSMSACGSGTQKWKEEVQLTDGKVIVVERETIHEAGGDEWAFNRSGSKPKERRIRFEYPNGSGKMVEWYSSKKDDRTWPEKPLILDVEGGQPFIFTLVAISICCEVYSKYVYQNGLWIEEPLLEQFEQRTTNLFIRDGTDMPAFVNLETKREKNDDSGYRSALKQVGPSRKVTFP